MTTLPCPRRRLALATGLGALALLATGCGRREAWTSLPSPGTQRFSGLSMGTTYTVKIATPGLTTAALAAARQAVASALDEVVGLMSHYDAGSELSRLNRHPVGRPFAVSESTARVFEVALAVQQASDGAFDVGVGRAVDAWGFGPSGAARRVLPEAALAALRREQRPDGLRLDAHTGTVTRLAPVAANLSGIAKGHAVDRAVLALQALGFGDLMVEVGGEIRTLGRNGQGQPWQLAIERPDAVPQQALLIVPLSGRSLATSGDYRNFFMADARRYCHEIDPASAAPVAHGLASVSVIADDCTQADAWSTALFVQGPQHGLATATRLGLAAHFLVRRAAGGFAETVSPGFAALGARAVA